MIYLIQGNLVMALAHSSSTKVCKTWFNFYLWMIVPIHITFAAIAYGRLHAAFSCNKTLSRLVSIVLGSAFIVVTVLLAIVGAKNEVVVLPAGWTGCIPYNTVSYGLAMWVPAATSEGMLSVLLLSKVSQLVWRKIKPPTLLAVILRDTAVFLIMSIAAVMIATGVQGVTNTTFVAFPPLLVVLLSINGCRMLLNIHRRIDGTRMAMAGSMSLELYSFSSLDFST